LDTRTTRRRLEIGRTSWHDPTQLGGEGVGNEQFVQCGGHTGNSVSSFHSKKTHISSTNNVSMIQPLLFEANNGFFNSKMNTLSSGLQQESSPLSLLQGFRVGPVLDVLSYLSPERKIFVRTENGVTICFVASTTASISTLKEIYKMTNGISLAEQHYRFRGVRISENSPIPAAANGESTVLELQIGMHIRIRNMNMTIIDVVVPKTQTVNDLKKMIQETARMPPERQKLIYRREEILDEEVLDTVVQTDRSFIHMVLRRKRREGPLINGSIGRGTKRAASRQWTVMVRR
jgi:hypothetical protein